MSKDPRPDLKTGDVVRLKGYPGTYIMSTFNGKQCIKVPGVMGWLHYEPERWEDLEKADAPKEEQQDPRF